MLIFDELRKNDPQLRLLAVAVAAGLFILFAGLWWVQVVSAREYRGQLETQAYRTVRVPAMRGKILDCEGRVLAENAPRYNLSLYFDDLRKQFADAYTPLHQQALIAQQQTIAAKEKQLHRSLTKAERKQLALTTDQIEQLQAQARYSVASKVVSQVSQKLNQPLTLDQKDFEKKYNEQRALPYPILKNLDDDQIARVEEELTNGIGVELDLQPTRVYALGMTASLLLGYVQSDDSSIEGEDSYFDYRLPDYKGVVGIEGGFDTQLHGHAGAEAVLVNNLGYRQTENVWEEPESGKNVVTTIDLDLQRAAEESLAAHQGADARAAIVVMDVRTGDVLAMVSSPAMDPNYYTGGLTSDEFQKATLLLANTNLSPEINKATQGSYLPGSIFKPIVALAALENGLDPNEIYQVQPDPAEPWHGYIKVGSRTIKDTVPPGNYDLKRAIEQSSNSYFIFNGLRTGIEKIVRLGEKFHLGQREDLPTYQDGKGTFPTLERINESDWRIGDSANICFGQGEVAVTPMQVAVVYSAIANGGTVLWPRLVEKIEPQDPASGEATTTFPSGVVRDQIGVSQRSLQIVHDAMLSETEDPIPGTAYPAFHQHDSVLNLHVCGKSGTAQVWNEHNQLVSHNYWFASFAPYENPKYAVVVMVHTETSGSGAIICAPIAHDIYAEILKKENAGKIPAIAKN